MANPKKETGPKCTPFGKYYLRKDKELEPREYENVLDDEPCLENFEKIYDWKNVSKGKPPLRSVVPHRAYVHETSDLIQLNCCLTPWCENFGKPCLTNDKGDDTPDSSIKLSPGYSFVLKDDTERKGLKITCLRCDSCKDWTRIHSNRAASQQISRFVRKYVPALFCDHCSCGNSNGQPEENPYIWDYANPSPQTLFNRNGVHHDTGAVRLLCKNEKCESKSKTPYWNPFPKGFSGIGKEPENHVRNLHDVANLSLSDYRRSQVYLERNLPVIEPSNPKLGSSYYSALDKYQFLAVEWIGHYNNQIRYGKADIKPITKREDRDKKKITESVEEELAAMDDDDGEDLAAEASLSLPSDVEKKDIPYFSMPQIQTDTFMLSTHTPGMTDKRQELRLIVSILVPSGYILLATLNYSNQYNFSSLEEHDNASNEVASLDIHGADRDLSIHAHNEKMRDYYISPDRGSKGRLHTIDFEGKGVRIRDLYHSIAHYFALEKITAKIPEIMLVQDMEKMPLRSCIWAFRRRIVEKTCHVITTQVPKDKKDRKIAEKVMENDAMKSNKVLTKKLVKDVDEAKKKDLPRNIRSSGDRIAFYSSLFSRGGVSVLPRKKVWITANTLMEIDSMNAAMMLRGASLFIVDSVCNQLRKRVSGLHRGEQASKNTERSYVSHWKNPLIVQQLVDVFVFSKNCLAWHSVKEGYLPPVVQLGLSIPNKHLIHYTCSPGIQSYEFISEKYRFSKS